MILALSVVASCLLFLVSLMLQRPLTPSLMLLSSLLLMVVAVGISVAAGVCWQSFKIIFKISPVQIQWQILFSFLPPSVPYLFMPSLASCIPIMCTLLRLREQSQCHHEIFKFMFCSWIIYLNGITPVPLSTTTTPDLISPSLIPAANLQAEAESKENMVCGTLCRSWTYPNIISTPESTTTYLPWATLCQSRP